MRVQLYKTLFVTYICIVSLCAAALRKNAYTMTYFSYLYNIYRNEIIKINNVLAIHCDLQRNQLYDYCKYPLSSWDHELTYMLIRERFPDSIAFLFIDSQKLMLWSSLAINQNRHGIVYFNDDNKKFLNFFNKLPNHFNLQGIVQNFSYLSTNKFPIIKIDHIILGNKIFIKNLLSNVIAIIRNQIQQRTICDIPLFVSFHNNYQNSTQNYNNYRKYTNNITTKLKLKYTVLINNFNERKFNNSSNLAYILEARKKVFLSEVNTILNNTINNISQVSISQKYFSSHLYISPLPRLIIITPSYRPYKLAIVKSSIRFHMISKWIIIHDMRKSNHTIFKSPIFDKHPKIFEIFYHHMSPGGDWGNPQRNIGITSLTNDDQHLVYFLDDDNIIHPNFWIILQQINCKTIATFNMEWPSGSSFPGNRCEKGHIDSSMFLGSRELIGSIRWDNNSYSADGEFLESVCKSNRDKLHKYFPFTAAYTNGQVHSDYVKGAFSS